MRITRAQLAAAGAGNLRRRLGELPLPPIATAGDHPPLDQGHLLDWYRALALHGWHARTLLLRELDHGVRVGPGVQLGRGVRLVGPCVIAAGATLGDGVTVGPDAYVGARALVCDGGRLANAVLGDDSALAPAAVLESVGAFGPVRLPLSPGVGPGEQRSIAVWEGDGGPGLRGAAVALLVAVLSAPFALVAALLALAVPGPWLVRRRMSWFDGPGLHGERAVTLAWWRLPRRGLCGLIAAPLRRLGLGHWPSLWAVVAREVGWQGVRPASAAQWRGLSSQERGVRQRLGPGLIDAHRLLLATGARVRPDTVRQFLVTRSRRERRAWLVARWLGRPPS
jgi:hypothetical protein